MEERHQAIRDGNRVKDDARDKFNEKEVQEKGQKKIRLGRCQRGMDKDEEIGKIGEKRR